MPICCVPHGSSQLRGVGNVSTSLTCNNVSLTTIYHFTLFKFEIKPNVPSQPGVMVSSVFLELGLCTVLYESRNCCMLQDLCFNRLFSSEDRGEGFISLYVDGLVRLHKM